MRPGVKIILFCLLSLVFIGCDRVTKDLAKEHLKDKAPTSYLNDTFRLQYAENTGAAMGLGDELSKKASFWLLSMLPLGILAIVFLYTIKNAGKLRPIKMFCIALIFAGGLGNIIDRILFDRAVTDFLNIGFGSVRTGIFNVADMCVTVGAIGLLLFYRDKYQRPPSDVFQTSEV